MFEGFQQVCIFKLANLSCSFKTLRGGGGGVENTSSYVHTCHLEVELPAEHPVYVASLSSCI